MLLLLTAAVASPTALYAHFTMPGSGRSESPLATLPPPRRSAKSFLVFNDEDDDEDGDDDR